MKKVIAAFDGLKYSTGTRDYSINLASEIDAHLVGVFMDDQSYTSYKIYELITDEGVSESRLMELEAEDNATREAAAQDFEKACSHVGLQHSIHHDKKTALLELKHESIYADLLIIDSKETLIHHAEKMPTHFIRDLLADAQCPVLLVPSDYKPVEKIILLYDGAPSSVHAIKMFSYLFPQLEQLPVEAVTVNPVNTSLILPDNTLIKEFMKRHYPKVNFIVTEGWAETEIVKHLKQTKENALVVLGAYRRGAVSRLFRESMADTLMKEVKLPLFVAHNK